MQQAVKNSKTKNYHGKMEEMHKIPTSEEQIQTLLKNVPKVEDYYQVVKNQTKEGQKSEFEYEISTK